MSRKSYKASAKASKSPEPFQFEVGGEEFDVAYPLPTLALLDLAAITEGTESEQAAAVSNFFKGVLPDGDYPRFQRGNRIARLEMEDLADIMGDIVEASTGNPTPPQSGLQATSSTIGTGSQVSATETESVTP